ncbi:MAG: type I CRISPR-associated protein Cas7 [Prolixibacteraceae bacterium]|jgi:Cas7 group CRISPR-associated protein Csh2|nr:type I CRISPR-associated protein Cas7 [Prolixibacteraceae bacterium]
MESIINRGTGLLVIEAVNSNVNGDPDRESDPRQRHDGRGEISPVSFKRKVRDLVLHKDGPVWKEISKSLEIKEDDYLKYDLLEKRDIDRQKVIKELKENTFLEKYWDARIFGNTFLEGDLSDKIQTGVAQFGLAVSISPIKIERMTTTKVAPVEDDKSRGMAPLAFRIVQHGVYCMPFFINATAASKTNCKQKDIDLLLKLIPYAYTNTASYIRPQVNIRYAFYVEHNSPLGKYNDFEIIDALTPKRIGDAEKPSTSWKDYDSEGLKQQIKELEEKLKNKTQKVRDLMGEM